LAQALCHTWRLTAHQAHFEATDFGGEPTSMPIPRTGNKVAVVHSIQRHARQHRRPESDEIYRDESGNVPATEPMSDQERREVVEGNISMPRLAGMLLESSRGLLGRDSDQARWVVLNPAVGKLSIWDRPPEKDEELPGAPEMLSLPQGRGPFASGARCPKAPRKVYSMQKFMDIDSNPSFRNMFIRFEGEKNVLCITASGQEEFQEWMDAFHAYSTRRSQASKM